MMRDRVAAELNKEITIIFIFLYNCDRYEDSGHFTSNSGPDTLTVTHFTHIHTHVGSFTNHSIIIHGFNECREVEKKL